MPSHDYQERVDSHFDERSLHWAEIYSTRSVQGTIYRERMEVILKWVDELALPKGSRVLEIGCGAGLTTVELARRGYAVDAIDSSEAMAERTRRNVMESGVGDRVKVVQGDANSLSFEDDLFTLVLAIGVIPWLESPDTAVREMARVVKPSGYVTLSSDNLLSLIHI